MATQQAFGWTRIQYLLHAAERASREGDARTAMNLRRMAEDARELGETPAPGAPLGRRAQRSVRRRGRPPTAAAECRPRPAW